jgi:hypothetical protein
MTTNPFPPTSRYAGLAVLTMQDDTGSDIVYLARRFVPQPERFTLLQLHTVTQGERLDNIVARYSIDPDQFWRVCDANRAMQPDALTETIGRKLRITLPLGFAGIALG